jgi:hypothetical protein
MSNPVENQRSRQQGRQKTTNQLRFAAKRNPLHQNQKKHKYTHKHTHTHTHKPRALKRNRDNNHNPQARLLYPQDFTKFEPTYLLACNISESWRQLSLYHLTIQREIETKAQPKRRKKKKKKKVRAQELVKQQR